VIVSDPCPPPAPATAGTAAATIRENQRAALRVI
jgi:hypothetical protein